MENNEFEQRRQTVASGLAEHKLDGLLISLGPNLRYLSGFTGSNGLLLMSAGRAILFTDPRYTIQAGQESTCEVRISRGPLIDDVMAAIAKLRLKRVGYEPAMMSCDAFQSLDAKLPSKASLVAVRGWIEELRMVKSPAEIERIRTIGADQLEGVRTGRDAREGPGMKEQDLAAELEYRMRRLGAEKPSFETIVAGGERSALPHAQPTAARFQSGELIVVDMGAFAGGLLQRHDPHAVPGLAERQGKAHLQGGAGSATCGHRGRCVRAGARTAAVDAATRNVLKGYGLDGAFIHSTGHGLGLEIHEPPRLGQEGQGP